MQATSTDGLAADGVYAGSSPPLGSGFLRAVCLIAAVLALAACGGGSSADEAGRRPTDAGPAQYPGVLAQIGVALSDIPEPQRPFFEDGVITFEEYEQAVVAEIGCVSELGVEILSGPALDPSGMRVEFSVRLGAVDFPTARAMSALTEECYREYAAAVTAAWAWQTRPTEQQLIEAHAALTLCLAAHSVELPESAFDETLGELVQTYPLCFEGVQREFKIPYFVGHYPSSPQSAAP